MEFDCLDLNDVTGFDWDNGNITKNESYGFEPIPEFMQELVESGGLINYAKKGLKSE